LYAATPYRPKDALPGNFTRQFTRESGPIILALSSSDRK
jgi:hypothetical protein